MCARTSGWISGSGRSQLFSRRPKNALGVCPFPQFLRACLDTRSDKTAWSGRSGLKREGCFVLIPGEALSTSLRKDKVMCIQSQGDPYCTGKRSSLWMFVLYSRVSESKHSSTRAANPWPKGCIGGERARPLVRSKRISNIRYVHGSRNPNHVLLMHRRKEHKILLRNTIEVYSRYQNSLLHVVRVRIRRDSDLTADKQSKHSPKLLQEHVEGFSRLR